RRRNSVTRTTRAAVVRSEFQPLPQLSTTDLTQAMEVSADLPADVQLAAARSPDVSI
ncbi:unnamed protein product, partial [Urochloa humidicola]